MLKCRCNSKTLKPARCDHAQLQDQLLNSILRSKAADPALQYSVSRSKNNNKKLAISKFHLVLWWDRVVLDSLF